MSFNDWKEGLAEVCSGFQLDLSCLMDNELDSAAAARAMLHLEACPGCREFFEETRRQVQLHQDMADPDRLMARVAMLTGTDLMARSEEIDLANRLATIFYELGKAYTLAAIDPETLGYQIFEAAVPVEATKNRGRGFVDGVLLGGMSSDSPVDWRHARHLLNGRLERIEDPLEKGRRLLDEAISVDPSHEEARLYIAVQYKHQGKTLQAAEAYREVFDTAFQAENRVHAAINLGRLYHAEENRRKALLFWRWVLAFGLGEGDERFWSVYYNIGNAYAYERAPERSLAYFRRLLDRWPARAGDLARAFARSPQLQRTIDSQEGFTEALLERCPELFSGSMEPDDLD
jgi:tetratricopeptide (TPR) repeat protein